MRSLPTWKLSATSSWELRISQITSGISEAFKLPFLLNYSHRHLNHLPGLLPHGHSAIFCITTTPKLIPSQGAISSETISSFRSPLGCHCLRRLSHCIPGESPGWHPSQCPCCFVGCLQWARSVTAISYWSFLCLSDIMGGEATWVLTSWCSKCSLSKLMNMRVNEQGIKDFIR